MPGDIDVWPDAEPDVLRKYGHTRFPDKEWAPHHTHLPLLDETEVELHFQPSYMYNPVTNRRLLAFCRKYRKACTGNRVLLEGTDRPVAIATDTFNRVYVLQHIMRHLFGEGIGLRQLTDYALVLRKGMPPAEKEETLQTLRRMNMEGFTGAVMYVLQTVFALEPEYLLCPPDEKKGKLLLEEILEGGNFGFYDRRGGQTEPGEQGKETGTQVPAGTQPGPLGSGLVFPVLHLGFLPTEVAPAQIIQLTQAVG